jgi:hypothetical protein
MTVQSIPRHPPSLTVRVARCVAAVAAAQERSTSYAQRF